METQLRRQESLIATHDPNSRNSEWSRAWNLHTNPDLLRPMPTGGKTWQRIIANTWLNRFTTECAAPWHSSG
eukprot:2335073-Alexandrium_andersonii.AAC.1